MHVEYVLWIDPASIDEWTKIDEIDLSGSMIESIGFLVNETQAAILLSLNHDIELDSVSCSMVIPKRCILNRLKVNLKS